ncbi:MULTISPECIES: hypothetical protein [Paenibacillus]|uniref:hypothetical protein n=1 Tax=Paenibacillus TaxID=44249 RepID=UPI000FD9B054|nr:hypothetical protein [Paenibacillus amylolyticus]
MNIDDTLENKINQLTEEIKNLSENVISNSSTMNHRIIAVEKLTWKIERKLVDQEKFLKLLSSNELIDRLVTMKYGQSKIKPFHLESEEFQKSSVEAMYDDDDD